MIHDCIEDEAGVSMTTEITSTEQDVAAKTTCNVGDIVYEDDDEVPSEDPCNVCICDGGQIFCVKMKCTTPEGKENCTPLPAPEGKCCPEEFECGDDVEIMDDDVDSIPDEQSTETAEQIDESPEEESELSTTTEITTADPDVAVGTETSEQTDESIEEESDQLTTTEITSEEPEVTEMTPTEPAEVAKLTCQVVDIVYKDKAEIPNEDPCNLCFCDNGEIVCATMECPAPPDKANCVPLPIPEGKCCPEEFECGKCCFLEQSI